MTRFTTPARIGARTGLLLTIASCLLTLAPPALAADDNAVPRATLNVAHTDFTSAKSVAQLKHRIRNTAMTICALDWNWKGLMSIDDRQCYDTAMRTGLAQVETKRLAAIHKSSPDMAAVQPEELAAH